MGKEVYTVNGRMYIIDDEGNLLHITASNEPISPKDMEDIIKVLAKAANKNHTA